MNVEAVSEHQRLAGLQVRSDVFAVHAGLMLVGQQDHDHIGGSGSFRGGHGGKAVFLGKSVVGTTGTLTDNHVEAGITQILGMRMALAAVTDNGNGLVFEKIQVRVLFIEGFHVLSLTGNSKHSENTAQRGPSQNHLRACA